MKKNYNDFIKIPNGSWIGSKDGSYDFGYKNSIILEGCINFSYVTGRLITFKKNNKIYIFSTKIINKGENETVEKLMEFTSYSSIARAKVVCERYMYLIDNNCQVTFTNRAPIN